MTVRHVSLVVLCVAVLGCGSGSAADTIFGRGGEVQWIDVPDGRLKTEVYSSTPLSARPVLVIVLHGDLFNPTPSYQPLDLASGVRRNVIVRLLVGKEDEVVTPPDVSLRYAEVLRKRGVDAQVTVLPGLGHNIMFTQSVFAEIAGLLRSG